jgi:xanthine dehydrogenase molybdopterin-binding subunit B
VDGGERLVDLGEVNGGFVDGSGWEGVYQLAEEARLQRAKA